MFSSESKARSSREFRTALRHQSLLAVSTIFVAAVASAQLPDFNSPHHPQHLLVRFKPNTSQQTRQTLHAACGAVELRTFSPIDGLVLVHVPAETLQQACAAYLGDANVLYAEPDYHLVLHSNPCFGCPPFSPGCPDDTHFGEQWGLHNTGQTVNGDDGTCDADIDAPAAWKLWTGDSTFKVAVLDSGVDYNHPDLAGNFGPDKGHDFADGDTDPMPGDPEGGRPNYHGTHVAGIIGAVGDNAEGVAGINWECQLVALKIFPSGPQGPAADPGLISNACAALTFVIINQIKVSNNSWGLAGGFSQTLYDCIEAARDAGHIFVAAVAPQSIDHDVDQDGIYPSAYNLDNIIAVTSTDNDDERATGSGFGLTSVDLGAPGVNIFSTGDPDDCTPLPCGYEFRSGTSMAAPHVTGVVALVWSAYPQMDYRGVIDKVLLTVRRVSALAGKTVTGGVVNAHVALDCNCNGVMDDADIVAQTSEDLDGDIIPDECEAAGDCNGNGYLDSCDIGKGSSADVNDNGIPDECEPGACCLSAGGCDVQTEPACMGGGGAFLGLGTTCPTGATGGCCLSDGACVDTLEECCDAFSGWWRGVGTACPPPQQWRFFCPPTQGPSQGP